MNSSGVKYNIQMCLFTLASSAYLNNIRLTDLATADLQFIT